MFLHHINYITSTIKQLNRSLQNRKNISILYSYDFKCMYSFNKSLLLNLWLLKILT